MLRSNTYKENVKKVMESNKKEILELRNDIYCLTTLRHYNPQMGNLNLAMREEIELYKVVREKANKYSLNDKDVNSWIIVDAVDADKHKDNTDYIITRDMVTLIRCNNPSDNIITNFIHEDCYEELVEILGGELYY